MSNSKAHTPAEIREFHKRIPTLAKDIGDLYAKTMAGFGDVIAHDKSIEAQVEEVRTELNEIIKAYTAAVEGHTGGSKFSLANEQLICDTVNNLVKLYDRNMAILTRLRNLSKDEGSGVAAPKVHKPTEARAEAEELQLA